MNYTIKTKLLIMINNYDSVATRISLGATSSQKQDSTSYTATKRNWLSFVTVFVALLSFVFVQGQTTLISPTGAGGFENGSTFAANGWLRLTRQLIHGV